MSKVVRIHAPGGPEVLALEEQEVGAPGAGELRGTLFIYGGLSGQPTLHPRWPAAFKNLSIRGWVASTLWNHPERFARAKQLILRGLAELRLKPVIARTFRLEEIVAAHRYHESNQQVGKIVVLP